MLWRCLSVLGLPCTIASGSRVGNNRYRRLKRPVVLPLKGVAEIWSPVLFSARCSAPNPADGPGSDVLLKGILLRLPLPQPRRRATDVKAFCLNCPHELCNVNFTVETAFLQLPPAMKAGHPLFVCPCHYSVFDPLADGARLSGLAPRGLYRFRLAMGRNQVEIREVEEEALG